MQFRNFKPGEPRMRVQNWRYRTDTKPTVYSVRVHPMPCKVVHFYVRKFLSQSEQTSNFSLLIWLAGRFTHVEMYDFTVHRVYP